MTFNAMMTCPVETLRTHYEGVRALSYNNAQMAQSCRGSSLQKLANQQGYLQRQISMCETAARRRGTSLV